MTGHLGNVLGFSLGCAVGASTGGMMGGRVWGQRGSDVSHDHQHMVDISNIGDGVEGVLHEVHLSKRGGI